MNDFDRNDDINSFDEDAFLAGAGTNSLWDEDWDGDDDLWDGDSGLLDRGTDDGDEDLDSWDRTEPLGDC